MDDRLKFRGIGKFCFAIAGDAMHKYGNLGQKEGLCLIYGETSEHWVGRWLVFEHKTHSTIYDVMFPKKTTTLIDNQLIRIYEEVVNSSWVKGKMLQHEPDLLI